MKMKSNGALALGCVLSVFGALGIITPLITDVPFLHTGPVAFSLGFVVGMMTGLGATLAIYNLAAARCGTA